MGRPLLALVVVLAAALAVQPVRAADAVALDNPYVRVTQDAAPCATAAPGRCEDRIVVALGNLEIVAGGSRRTMKRGEAAVFRANQSYAAPNGAPYFEVAIKPDHPALKAPPEAIAPDKNTNVYENEKFFIYEERLAVGDTRPRHSHAQRVEIRINQGPRLVQIIDGRDTPLEPPTIVNFREPIIHVTTNVGDMPLWNFILEFKPPAR
jgi:hypothetical protein